MNYQTIQSNEELAQYLESIQGVSWIGLDTEFISEGKTFPQLCLVQLSTEKGLALIDAIQIPQLDPFWDFLCSADITVLAHACRSEMEFCFHFTGKLPARVFDVQLAAGMVGTEYPLSFKNLVHKILNREIQKNETRTRWDLRPLSERQIQYALDDVLYLRPLATRLQERLNDRQRFSWFLDETRHYLNQFLKDFSDEKWHKIKSIKNLTQREQFIAHNLWTWRQQQARQLKKSPRTILRDDLIVELAKRKSADENQIMAVRGMIQKAWFRDALPSLCQNIQKSLDLDQAALPEKVCPNNGLPEYSLAVHFLSMALSNFAQQQHLAFSILATPQDIREYLAWHQGRTLTIPPKLCSDWRQKFLGTFLSELLAGRQALRISSASTDLHLEWIPVPPKGTS